MPKMGISAGTSSRTERQVTAIRQRASLADALFSSTQQRVLALFFGEPHRSFYANEVIGRLGAGSGAVQRELRKLADSGLVSITWHGNQKHYQANPNSPIFEELRSLMRKTVGVVDPLLTSLAQRQNAIDLALIYGFVAKRSETATSDIDLLLVSDELTLEEVYRLLIEPERILGRPIHPTIYTGKEFRKRLESGSTFLKRVLADDTIVLLGELPG